MRTKNLINAAVGAAVLVLAAPVVASQADSDWREVAYTCETGQALTIAYRETGSAVQVRAADRPAVKLNARPAKEGFRYGDSRHELRGDAGAVTWQIGSKSPVKCTSEDPAAQNLAALATR